MLRAEVRLVVRTPGPEREEAVVLEECVEAAESESEKDARGEAAAALASHQHVGAGGAFGIDEGSVLFDDELAAQGNHEENAQPSAEERECEDAGRFKIEAQEDERRQCEDNARGDGLSGVSRGLDDVVLEDAGAAEGAQDGD